MSQTRNTALDAAIAHAAEHHLRAEKALATAQTRLRTAQSTHATLDAYRAEYVGRLRHVTAATKDALTNHRHFLGKLAAALDQQQQGVAQAGEVVAHRQDAWSGSLRKLKAMEWVRDRRAAAADAKQKRLEQKQSDEYAARAVRAARASQARSARSTSTEYL